ncbi:MAG: sugar transferase [Planctomycetaceae bacterium]|nr:sugar transferase [Planctomycetaceae bacterium]
MKPQASTMPAVAADPNGSVASPRLWGLDSAALHDAYWSSHGVACVRLGSGVDPQPGADLYLLLEQGQAANFDLRRIAESLLWNQAHITRLRIVDRTTSHYSERVVQDAGGSAVRIERRYGADRSSIGQVLLGTRREDAIEWSRARTPTEAFAAMRRRGRVRFDATECDGERFDLGIDESRDAMVRSLVRDWAHPDHVIQGVVRLEDGIFGRKSGSLREDSRLIAPVWVGSGAHAQPVCIGPSVLWDSEPTAPATVRPIEELFSEDRESESRGASDPGGWYAPLKRLIDILASALVLICFAPVLLLCAVAIVIDDGFPIFFGHKRQTKGGATFRCWKFRTMRRNAEALVAELRKQNLCDGPQVNIKDDPRVTRVGKYLRKLQLDEFPQFWNVLVGDMSIVGPRPSPDNENQFCPAWREIRLSVRPGITGNWQVKRTRAEGKDFQEWIQYDIEYVERMGPLFDLWLCILTVVNIIRRR